MSDKNTQPEDEELNLKDSLDDESEDSYIDELAKESK